MDAAQLGDRLRAARDRRGLSQQAVADALGLPRTAVTNMETGARAVSTLEITKLADLYGQTPAYFLSPNEAKAEDLFVVLHRVLPRDRGSAGDRSARSAAFSISIGKGPVCAAFSIKRRSKPSRTMRASFHRSVMPFAKAKLVAQEERRRLRLGTAPIVNAAETISEQGVWTGGDRPAGWPFRPVREPSFDRPGDPGEQEPPAESDVDSPTRTNTPMRCSTAARRSRRRAARMRRQLAEKRANAFAAAFLMPTEGVADHLRQLDKGSPSRRSQTLFDVANDSMMEAELRTRPGSQSITYQDVASLARRFGVSYEAAVWRLKSLGHIGAGETTALLGSEGDREQIHARLGVRGPLRGGEDQRATRAGAAWAAGAACRRGIPPGRDFSRPSHRNRQEALLPDPSVLVEFAEATRAG